MKSAVTSVRELYRGWMSLLMVRLRLPDGQDMDRHVMLNCRAVCVLPYDPDRRTALVVSMLRAPVAYLGQPDMLEAIAGALDDEDPDACVKREAFEEAGVELKTLQHLGRIWSMPSNSTEQIDYYLAPYRITDRKGVGGGLDEEQEQISVHELPLSKLWCMAQSKKLFDGKLMMLLQALYIRYPALFA